MPFMWHVDLEAAPPPAGTSWLESASPAKPSTTLCAQVAFLVMPSPVTSMMLCGIVQIRGTSAALLPAKFNMLVCSSVRTNCPLTAFDDLTFHYDLLAQLYFALPAALRQYVAIFCHRSLLPWKMTLVPPFFLMFPFPFPSFDPIALPFWLKLALIPPCSPLRFPRFALRWRLLLELPWKHILSKLRWASSIS